MYNASPLALLKRLTTRLLATAALVGAAAAAQAAEPLKIGYSDWPGWVAWQVAIDKGWFKEAGVDAKFEWFDYSASMDAYSAGKLDAVLMTNGDALVTGAGGARSTIILITDYSAGNDLIIAKPGIKSLADLKGKKVAVEVGLVDHLLLRNAMKKAGMAAGDITIVNAKTNELPQVFASKDIAAVGVWQPVANEALKAVPGSRAIYTSADEPGLIYDVLAVNPASAKSRRAEWQKVVAVWGKVVAYIEDPKTQADAVKIMAARSGVSAAEYLPLLKGTRLLTPEENRKTYARGNDYKSIYGSTEIVNNFNWFNKVYTINQKVDSYIDPSFVDPR
jgi:NitT/TauT family transport system substrate-binding protein